MKWKARQRKLERRIRGWEMLKTVRLDSGPSKRYDAGGYRKPGSNK